MATFDLTSASTNQGNTLVSGATFQVIAGQEPAIAVSAAKFQGVNCNVPGGPFSGAQTLSVWLKGESTGQVVHCYFGYHTAGDWGPNANLSLTTDWVKYDLTWTPTVQRTTAGLAIRSESNTQIVFDVNSTGPAPPPPPPPAPDVQAQVDELKALLYGGKTGQVFARGLSGPEWAPLTAPGVATKPPPPAAPPALMGRAYSNQDLFSSGSFWKKPVPADPPLHPDSEAVRQHLCAQYHVDPASTGAFPMVSSGIGSTPWFNVGGGNYRVVVLEESDAVLPVRAADRWVMAGLTAQAGWWHRPFHDWTMTKGIPIPDGIQANRARSDSERGVTIWDKPNDILYEVGGLREVGDPDVVASSLADGKTYEGSPPGTFEGKTFKWTYSNVAIVKNVSQNPGVFKDVVTPAGVAIPGNVVGMASSGFPFIAGLITPEECRAVLESRATNFGHALKTSVFNNAAGFVSPATRTDVPGVPHLTSGVQSGMRWRLKVTDFTPYANEKLLTRALIETGAIYGFFAADRTGLAMDCPNWRDPSAYPTQPYGPEFYPNFFGVAGQWKAPDILSRVPWHTIEVLDPSMSPA